ncbi:hypothetical protein HDU93_005678 [Gonapodya sp. JEL0774]|nr:hypothetical protein HDU93_005678 [Gonapodya sp. JEL0774]
MYTTGLWAHWAPSYIYDTFMRDKTGSPVTNYYNLIATDYPGDPNLLLDDLITDFENNFEGVAFTAASDVYGLATSLRRSAYLQPKPNPFSNTSTWIWTKPGVYQDGTALHHVEDAYFNTADFLMISYIPQGVTLNSTIYKYSSTTWGPFGPHLLSNSDLYHHIFHLYFLKDYEYSSHNQPIDNSHPDNVNVIWDHNPHSHIHGNIYGYHNFGNPDLYNGIHLLGNAHGNKKQHF